MSSLRELTNLLNIVELAIHHKKERIRCSLLVHLLFKKFIKDNRTNQIFSEKLPINAELEQILNGNNSIKKRLLSQYTVYIKKAPEYFRSQSWRFPRNMTVDVFTNLETEFNQIKTYSDFLRFLNETNKPLQDLYSNIIISQESFFSLSEKLKKYIDEGVNTFGVFELKDEQDSIPMIGPYNALVNQLQI